LGVTTQSAVSVMASILPGHESLLQQLLESAGQDPANNALIPFERVPKVHFARFFVIGSATEVQPPHPTYPPRLIFLADADGPADAFMLALVGSVGDGLHTLYQHCQGYPGRAGLLDYLRANRVPEAATYVNAIGRTVRQIHQEAQLHDALEEFLDRSPTSWRGTRPARVRAAIQEFVEREPSLAWARQPAQKPDPSYILGEQLHFAFVAAAGIVLFPVILVGLPVYLAILRWHETHDPANVVAPDDATIQQLTAQEDHGVQNPYIAAGFLKPGPFRRFTGSAVLFGANFLARHIFNHADLIGVKTIHFARWVFMDHKRRLVFASNYDGSLENYMDDFIDKIAWALNIVFSNGVDYPRTNWLVMDGARYEQPFKRFNLMHQLVSPLWYAAYQGLTALNIENNARIRAGLYGAMDDAAARAWLRRL
jgi:hypothetical protein